MMLLVLVHNITHPQIKEAFLQSIPDPLDPFSFRDGNMRKRKSGKTLSL